MTIEFLGWLAAVQGIGLVGLGVMAARDRLRGRRPSEVLPEIAFTMTMLTFWPLVVPVVLAVRVLMRLGVFAEPRVALSTADDQYRIQRGRFGFYYGWLVDFDWNARWVAVGVPDRRWLGLTVGVDDRRSRR